MLVGDNPALNTTNTENNLEIKKEAKEGISHVMVKVHTFLEMWQGSQDIRCTQKESHAQNKYMPAIGYISDPEGIVKAS